MASSVVKSHFNTITRTEIIEFFVENIYKNQ